MPRIEDMPLADYLGLLRQIAPAAEAGAKDYLAAFRAALRPGTHHDELRRDVGR
jgi:hypothetical protein